jgi:hypothetical protein
MRWHWLVIGLAAIMLAVMALAWFDAGREAVGPIAQTVPVPPLPSSSGGQ